VLNSAAVPEVRYVVDKSILDNRLTALSARLDQIVPRSSGRSVYIDYPVHTNIGDSLIWIGAIRFMRRHRIVVSRYYWEYNARVGLKKHANDFTTIYCQGGGNFGDLWPASQKLREDIIDAYPNKKIIILPQSVHYENMAAFDQACSVLRRHPDLHILLRDRRSLDLLRERDLANLYLCPDMAHALWGYLRVPALPEVDTLRLFRRDKERGNLPPEVLACLPETVDWDDALTRPIRLLLDMGYKVQHRGLRFGNERWAYPAWRLIARVLTKAAIRLIAAHDRVVTDRLHASILSLLLGRNVIAYDNCYGKVSSYADCWLTDIPQLEIRNPFHAGTDISPSIAHT
jgi:pyruvyl transferase EpsO